MLAAGCATPQGALEPRVRASLEVMHDVVDPTYRFATDACAARYADLLKRHLAGDQAARPKYEAVKARCHEVRDAFRAIRAAHGIASGLVEEGRIDEAETELERLRALWRALTAQAPEVDERNVP